MRNVILSAAKNLSCDGQMLHFVQHDNSSKKLRQRVSSKGWLKVAGRSGAFKDGLWFLALIFGLIK